MKTNHNNYLNLAFNLAKINIGKTKTNPSVGCVVVKKNTVISSGYTSKNGRPHAEFNALKNKKNLKGSDIYVTLEPCTHKGITPPCVNIIKKKGIKRIFFSFDDVDDRTAKKLKFKLIDTKIKVFKKEINKYKDFYKSYFYNKRFNLPFVDAKIAVSKDYFTISKDLQWITNSYSRSRAHLIRSRYDLIISTSKSINTDNSLLTCRINGFDNNKPDLAIIDKNLKIKKNLILFKKNRKRKIFIIASSKKVNKINYLKNKGFKIIFMKSLTTKNDFKNLLIILKKCGYNRILVESGLTFLNELIKKKLIFNLYMFKTSINLGKKGKNNSTNKFLKKFSLKERLKVNLYEDNLFKVRIK